MESIQSASARDVQIKELINDFLKKTIARGTLTASDYYVSHMSEFDKHSINISDWYNAVAIVVTAITAQARRRYYSNRPKG